MTKRIVVGVDGSDGAVRALRWAIDEAALRGATLEVVNVWHFPYGGEFGGMASSFTIAESDLVEAAESIIERALAAAGPLPATLPVERRVMRDGAAMALLDTAKNAELLVVGSRGRGGFAGLLLGSVSQQCIHHAPCPVVVVPAEASL